MKRFMVCALAAFVTAGFVGTALAQGPPEEGGRPDGPPNAPRFERIFAAIDTDGDGMISPEEFEAHFDKMLSRRGGPGMPANDMPGHGRMMGRGPAQMGHGPMGHRPMGHRPMGHCPMERDFAPQMKYRQGPPCECGNCPFARDGERGPKFDGRGPQRGGFDGERGPKFDGRGPQRGGFDGERGPKFDGRGPQRGGFDGERGPKFDGRGPQRGGFDGERGPKFDGRGPHRGGFDGERGPKFDRGPERDMPPVPDMPPAPEEAPEE